MAARVLQVHSTDNKSRLPKYRSRGKRKRKHTLEAAIGHNGGPPLDDPPQPPRRLSVTIQHAAELTDVSPDTIRRRIADGTLPAVKVAGRVLITYAALERIVGADQ
jgi:excisionase family DNA binding protein